MLFVSLVLSIALTVLLVRAFRYWRFRSGFVGWLPAALRWPSGPDKAKLRRSPAFLLINSRFDEAYRSLSAVPNEGNPLQGRGDGPKWYSPATLGSVFSAGRDRLALLVSGVLDTGRPGAAAVVGAVAVAAWLLWLPALQHLAPGWLRSESASMVFWLGATAMALVALAFDRFLVLPGIVTTETLPAIASALKAYLSLALDATLRRWVWATTQAFALGQSGAPESVADIDVRLAFASTDAEDCVYLELPEAIVERVIDAQSDRLGELHEILYRKAASWSPSGLRDALDAKDFPLVHTVYYRERACTQKVAEWLCEPVIEELDGRTKLRTTVPHGAAREGLQEMVMEEIEGANHYRRHVEQLQQTFGATGGEWSAVKKAADVVPPRQSGLAALSITRFAPRGTDNHSSQDVPR